MPLTELPPAPPTPAIPELLPRLRHIELDALRELANIGAGHAATALSEMTGRHVSIGVPAVSVAEREALAEIVGSRELPLIVMRIKTSGAFNGGLAIALTESAASALTDVLLGRQSQCHGWLDDLAASALKEVTNVLGAAYLNALATITGWTIPISTPRLAYTRANWALPMLIGENARCDLAICLDTSFMVEGVREPVKGHVLLFPSLETVQTLLKALGI